MFSINENMAIYKICDYEIILSILILVANYGWNSVK